MSLIEILFLVSIIGLFLYIILLGGWHLNVFNFDGDNKIYKMVKRYITKLKSYLKQD